MKYISLMMGATFMLLSIKIPDSVKAVHSQAVYYTQQQGPVWNIYLTIDDGPSPASAFIDSIAAAEKAPMNVFLLGRNVSGSLPYQANPFIETGNHSYSHADFHYRAYYRNAGEVLRDFKHNETVLHLSNKIARLPGRNTWRIQGRKQTDLQDANGAADSLAASGFHLVGWDLEWGYDHGSDTIQLAASVMFRIEKAIEAKRSFSPGHLVILCHESMFERSFNRQELPKLIRMINEKTTYSLQFLNKYPG